MTRSLTGDPITDELVPVAAQLVGAVRDADPDAVDRALSYARRVADGRCDPYVALSVVLAAMVDDDAEPSALLGWWGYQAEYLRLRVNGVDDGAARVLSEQNAAAG